MNTEDRVAELMCMQKIDLARMIAEGEQKDDTPAQDAAFAAVVADIASPAQVAEAPAAA